MLEKIKQIRKERKKEREISAKAKVGVIEKELEKLVKPLMKKTGLTKEEAIIHLKAKRRKRETVVQSPNNRKVYMLARCIVLTYKNPRYRY